MSHTLNATDNNKETLEQLEVKHDVPHDGAAPEEPLLVSNYATLSRATIIRRFWRLFIIGVLVSSAGM